MGILSALFGHKDDKKEEMVTPAAEPVTEAPADSMDMTTPEVAPEATMSEAEESTAVGYDAAEDETPAA